MTGLFFCLASTRCRAFIFSLLPCRPIQAFTARFVPSMQLYHQHGKTAHRALQGCFLRLYPPNRPRYQTDTSGYNATCATLEHITAPQHLQRVPDTSATPDAVQLSTAAYYNKVYKGAPLSWIHARQCSRPQTIPEAAANLYRLRIRWQVLHPAHPLRWSTSPPVQGQPGSL